MTRGFVVGAAGGRGIARLARSDPVAAVCAAILALAVIAAIFAPIVAPHDPSLVNLSVANEGPSGDYLLGTDGSGRDLLSRIIFGARSSLLGPLAVIVLATLLALTLALSSAWIGGWFDDTVSAGLDMVFAFPGLLLAIGAVAVFGVGLIAPAIALGIAYTPYIARVLRGAALRERRLPYVEALTIQGFSSVHIVTRHVLPNLRTLIVAQATLTFAYATIDLAAISYLGLGVQPPTPDWGLMVAQGQPAIIAHHAGQALYPGLALVLVVVAVTVLGRRVAPSAEALL
ncbi:MAG: ABC transporter permease [Solirubrobacterales bacterium]